MKLPDGWSWNETADALEAAIATGLGDVDNVRLVLAQSRDGNTVEVWRDSDGLYVHADGAPVTVVEAAIAKASTIPSR